MSYKKNRDEWMIDLLDALIPLFRAVDKQVPTIRPGFGQIRRRTIPGYRGPGAKAYSEVYDQSAAGDRRYEIVLSNDLENEFDIARYTLHELIHAVAGVSRLHKGEFEKIALALGFERPLALAVPSPSLSGRIREILIPLGPVPHAAIDSEGIRSSAAKQGTRLLPVWCSTCQYTVRVTRYWLREKGFPRCPDLAHGVMVEKPVKESGRSRARN